jgi:hypothetical protein
MPTLGDYQISGNRDRLRARLIQEANRVRFVPNAGLDSAAQLRDHIVASNGLTDQQVSADYQALNNISLVLEGVESSQA